MDKRVRVAMDGAPFVALALKHGGSAKSPRVGSATTLEPDVREPPVEPGLLGSPHVVQQRHRDVVSHAATVGLELRRWGSRRSATDTRRERL